MESSIVPPVELKSGLSTRSFFALVYAIVVFQPAMIWVLLVTGQIGFTGAVGWITFILLEEFARMYRKPLTKQESFIIMTCSNVAPSFTIFIDLIYRTYFRHLGFVKERGIAELIPPWHSPTGLEVFMGRTFLNPQWLLPIGLAALWSLFTLAADISMGLLSRQLYVEVERLPFPMQEVSASAIIAATEREPRRMRMFTLGIDVGLLFAFIAYGFPFIANALNMPGVPPISSFIPWVDYNVNLHRYIPGASLGIATDILTIALGFIVPFNVVVCMFIGSFAIHFLGNWLLVNYGVTQFAKEWFPGMGIALTMQRSTMHAWWSPTIGILLAAGIMPLICRPRILIDSFKGLAGISRVRERVMSLWLLLAIWLGASLSSVAVVSILVPGYPILFMLFFSIGWSFVWTLIVARSIGLTGIALSPPGILSLMKFGYITASGYPGVDIWFIDPVISMGGADYCANLKVAELCGCTAMSYLKAWLMVIPLAWISGFIYVEMFWRMAPIPSAMFSAPAIYWPLRAVMEVLWMGRVPIVPEWIGMGFAITAALHAISTFAHIPFSTIGFAAGVGTPIPMALTMLIGAIVRKLLERKIGKELLRKFAPTLVAGLSIGVAIVLVVASAAGMIIKSIWYLPY